MLASKASQARPLRIPMRRRSQKQTMLRLAAQGQGMMIRPGRMMTNWERQTHYLLLHLMRPVLAKSLVEVERC